MTHEASKALADIADEIEQSDGIALMLTGGPKQLGIKGTAMVIAALRSQPVTQAIERCIRELQNSYPGHAWLNAACACLRSIAPEAPAQDDTTYKIGRWLSAALDDPQVCEGMKNDILAWMEAGKPNVQPATPASQDATREALRDEIWCLRQIVGDVRLLHAAGRFKEFEDEPWLKRADNIDLHYDPCAALASRADRAVTVDERRAHKVMTPEEYAAMPIIGWHEVCRDIDGFGGVGFRFGNIPLIEGSPAADESDEWKPIETAPKDSCEILIAGRYSNGVRYVESSYWNPREHWNGRKLEPPTHWQPMRDPPDDALPPPQCGEPK